MADRISELPDSILSHILSLIPTKLTATTSILSKRWRSVWLSVCTLDFDDATFKDFQSFTNFVSSTMSARETATAPPIHSLSFKCSNESSPYDLKHMNQFLNLVVQQGQLENLDLHMPDQSTEILYLRVVVEIKLVPTIFSCRTLQVLKLNNLILRDITRDHNKLDLPLLKTLHWNGVVFESFKYLIKLLSSCPILQELQGYHSRVMFEKYSGEESFEGLLPNLVKAKIFDSYIPITLLSHVQNLHLETVYMKNIINHHVPKYVYTLFLMLSYVNSCSFG